MTDDGSVQRYNEPRLVFHPVEGKRLTIKVGLAYYPGCFTMSGMRDQHINPIVEWCRANNCGQWAAYDMFKFKSKKQMTMFLLRWS